MDKMTDKQFTRRLAKLNSMLFDCICEGETLLNTEQAKYIKNSIEDDRTILDLQELYNGYAKDCVCDCELHGLTLSDVTHLVSRLYLDE